MITSHHLRVRVAAVLVKDKKILLISHQKGGQIYWLLPGGGVDFGESLDQALKRELQEELNIKVKVNEPVLICDSIDDEGRRHILNICFFCEYLSGEYVLGQEERLYEFDFFEKEKLTDLKIYPPINKELIEFMTFNKIEHLYKGKDWIK